MPTNNIILIIKRSLALQRCQNSPTMAIEMAIGTEVGTLWGIKKFNFITLTQKRRNLFSKRWCLVYRNFNPQISKHSIHYALILLISQMDKSMGKIAHTYVCKNRDNIGLNVIEILATEHFVYHAHTHTQLPFKLK